MKLFLLLQISPQNYKYYAKQQRKSKIFCRYVLQLLAISHQLLAFRMYLHSKWFHKIDLHSAQSLHYFVVKRGQIYTTLFVVRMVQLWCIVQKISGGYLFIARIRQIAQSTHYFVVKRGQMQRSAQKIRRWIVLKRTAIVGFFCQRKQVAPFHGKITYLELVWPSPMQTQNHSTPDYQH